MIHMAKNIAVFKNTSGIVETMQGLFTAENLQTYKVNDLDELLQLIQEVSIQVILIDLKLDGFCLGDEFELIQSVRNGTEIPIIVVSPQTSVTAKIMSLNLGADDYITADDSPLIIMARIRVQLRRHKELQPAYVKNDGIYRTDSIEVNDQNHTVIVDGKDVKMTPIEYKILRLLVQEKGKILSIEQIYENIWNMPSAESRNIVAVHIRHIREKIEKNPKDPRYVKVVWGMGYKVG